MVPAHLTEVSAVFLMIVWTVVWCSFGIVGRHAKRRFTTNALLVRYSGGAIVSITFFYWLAFSDMGNPAGFLGGYSSLTDFLSDSTMRFGGIFLVLLGAAGMMFSRWELRELTLAEVLFAKCELSVHTGVYRYFNHPMYLGLFLMLFGSFILYPNLFALLFIVPVWFFVEKKKGIEESSYPT
ncbi:MAG: hypothetical protein NT108_02675 [Candidatus Kaiserbacteria bacterium]|nr:hypothetical protein [Candidatus Kaiserbacteria bacterium]